MPNTSLPPEQAVTIPVGDGQHVSGLLIAPDRSRACYVLAHGAGAGMTHPFLANVARGLASRGIATLRYNFRYMEQRVSRPDPPKVAHSVVRAAVRETASLLPSIPLFAGGKSFGGRMTSQAQALEPLPEVRGLVFLGFPLHPAGKPSEERAAHLSQTTLPLLFVQGTRDPLASLPLLEAVCARLGPRATLELLDEADHSFHVPARTGRKDAEVLSGALDTMARWMLNH